MTKNKECAEGEEKWWEMWRKQNMWQLFSSPKQTKERNVAKNVCMTVRPQMDVSGTWMTTYTLIYWHNPIICNIQGPVTLLHILYSYNTHTHCSDKGRTWMSLSLLSNFLLMGLQTISCFHLSYWFDLWPSHCLSWVQKLKIYRLSQVEEAVKKKKGFSGITWILNWFQVFLCDSTRFCIWLYWQTKLRWQQLSVWSDEVCRIFLLLLFLVARSRLWNLKWCCFQAPCFYPSYLLIAIFFVSAVLTELAGRWFKQSC